MSQSDESPRGKFFKKSNEKLRGVAGTTKSVRPTYETVREDPPGSAADVRICGRALLHALLRALLRAGHAVDAGTRAGTRTRATAGTRTGGKRRREFG